MLCIRTCLAATVSSGLRSLLPPLLTAASGSIPLDHLDQLELQNARTRLVTYQGRTALEITEAAESETPSLAVLKNLTLHDGAVELDIAGAPAPGAFEGAHGFVGVAFRVAPDRSRFEYIYLRPTNGRAGDQVRRNHGVQYSSHPDYPWQRLRKEEPEKYESYVDLEPGVWTKVRISSQVNALNFMSTALLSPRSSSTPSNSAIPKVASRSGPVPARSRTSQT
jgi:hypothetical protein